MPTLRVRDDLGRELVFGRAPARVVSLVPSDTHSLVALGLTEQMIGRTRYCEVPEVAHVATVGGTKDVDVEAICALAPELVIGNQEENSRVGLEALAQRGIKVFVSLPRRVEDAISHLARLARIFAVTDQAPVAALLRRGYQELRAWPPADAAASGRAFVPIWLDPLMTFNADTFGSDVLARSGVANVFSDRLRLYPLAADLGKAPPADATGRDVRYPRVSLEEVRRRAPTMVLLPDEPHEFSAEDERALAAELPGVPIVRCSGKDLFWYGAWTIDALPRLRALFAPRAAARD
ncbi:MAG: helical backbone metal receptor [Kofleriaceae bacterium]